MARIGSGRRGRPSYDPDGLRDLGAEDDRPDLHVHAEKIQSQLRRIFPDRHLLVFARSVPEAVAVPPGYSVLEVSFQRRNHESEVDFDRAKARLLRILENTELDLCQPNSGARYLRMIDEYPPRPVRGPVGDDPQAVMGWYVAFLVAPTLVRAEDIVLMEERIRSL